jgi:hypothetical protein
MNEIEEMRTHVKIETTNEQMHQITTTTTSNSALHASYAHLLAPNILLEQHQCTNCGTKLSPVWRKGPTGPKVPYDHHQIVMFILTQCLFIVIM